MVELLDTTPDGALIHNCGSLQAKAFAKRYVPDYPRHCSEKVGWLRQLVAEGDYESCYAILYSDYNFEAELTEELEQELLEQLCEVVTGRKLSDLMAEHQTQSAPKLTAAPVLVQKPALAAEDDGGFDYVLPLWMQAVMGRERATRNEVWYWLHAASDEQIKCITRPLLLANVDRAIAHSKRAKKLSVAGQFDMFALLEPEEVEVEFSYEGLVPWTIKELLQHERATASIYLSGHPLDPLKDYLANAKYHKIGPASDAAAEDPAILMDGNNWRDFVGILTEVEFKTTRKGERFMIGKLGDHTGEIKCIAWPKTLAAHVEALVEDAIVSCNGPLEYDSKDQLTYFIQRVVAL